MKLLVTLGLWAGAMALASVTRAQVSERRWDLTLEGFFAKRDGSPAPLFLYARERNGEWIAAIGTSRDPANDNRRTYNVSRYYGDLAALPLKDGKMKGRMVLHMTPDMWIPPDHKPYTIEIDLEAAESEPGKLSGAYKVAAVSSTDKTTEQFKGKSGAVNGAAKEAKPPAVSGPVTFELRLQSALIGGKPEAGERCLVLRLGFDGDKLATTQYGGLNNKREVFGLEPVEQPANAATCSPDRVKGRLCIPAKTLDMESATYTIDVDGRLVEGLVAGTYKADVSAAGKAPVAVAGSFDGSWQPGLPRIQQADTRPWWTPVKGFTPVQPGEHPRLLFRQSDVLALRKRAETPEGRAIIARLRVLLNGQDGESMPTAYSASAKAYDNKGAKDEEGEAVAGGVGVYTISHAAGYGLLYQLTGDKKYAELGRQCFEKAFEGRRDRDDRYSWQQPGGALRAGPSLGWYAVGYDLCYDGWDAATREKIGRAIAEYDAGRESKDAKANMDLEVLARGTMPPGSNHYGMQVGGAALAVLAVMGEPWVDSARIARLLAIGEASMTRNLTEGFGDGGFFAEGDGTGSMSSHIVYLSALQGWRNAMGRDYANGERPNARMTALKWIYLTVVRGGKPDFWPIRGAYGHNVWSRSGLSGGGYFAIGLGAVTDEQRAAMKWYYNHFLKEPDTRANAPYDTVSPYPHVAVSAFVNWPIEAQERNPAEVLPLCYRDALRNFYAWRNRWQDENDIVISTMMTGSAGYMKSKPDNALQIAAFGKKFKWGAIGGATKSWWMSPHGEASVLTAESGTGIAVDFTKASGADAMLVTTGTAEGQQIKLGAASLTFKFLTSGAEPKVEVRDDKAIVGKQTVAVKDDCIVLGVTTALPRL